MADLIHKKRGLTSFQIIILGFAGVILVGALLLTLPISTKSGTVTPFNEALFTSTSAVCVTGLVVQDTATYWSAFGQSIILVLIQIGGLGVITVAASFALLSGRKISLMQRSTMQEAIAAPKVNNGDKTKYHIMNDHEPIVTRDLFYAVQAEFAKRNTKRSVSDKAATIRGRYSGKYAFSELLVCGTCNGRYRRKTVKKMEFHSIIGDALIGLIMLINIALIQLGLKKKH